MMESDSLTKLFSISSLLVMPFWALMIFTPKWQVTQRLMQSPWIALGPAFLYAVLAVPNLSSLFLVLARPTFPGIMALLGTPLGATVAWFHFLAFDLLIGRWIYQDSQERKISALLISPILYLTLMFGPIGYLAYLLLRTLVRQKGTRLPESVQKAIQENAPLALITLACIAGLIASIFGMIFDHRYITGAPAWLKPAKFFVSIVIYSATLFWILQFVEGHKRLVKAISLVTAIGFVVEMMIIVTQVLRGTTSHFNVSTPFNAVLWSLMGGFILIVWLASLAVAVLLIRQPVQTLPSHSFALSLRWGVVLSALGMAIAFLMTRPTAAQMESVKRGEKMTISGAHAVNTPDDAPGMPVTHWSTTGGDLRIPHFVGLHALQALPLFGLLLLKLRRRLPEKVSVRLVHLAGTLYLGVMLLFTWQALRGEPLFALSLPILWSFAALGAIDLGGITQAMKLSQK